MEHGTVRCRPRRGWQRQCKQACRPPRRSRATRGIARRLGHLDSELRRARRPIPQRRLEAQRPMVPQRRLEAQRPMVPQRRLEAQLQRVPQRRLVAHLQVVSQWRRRRAVGAQKALGPLALGHLPLPQLTVYLPLPRNTVLVLGRRWARSRRRLQWGRLQRRLLQRRLLQRRRLQRRRLQRRRLQRPLSLGHHGLTGRKRSTRISTSWGWPSMAQQRLRL